MRCSKARELFFCNCDGTLDEAQKMKLEEHLGRCPSCASFAAEMEACLRMARGLPERSPSESFEWNLKRRLLQEKSRLMRHAGDLYIGDPRWGTKFLASAAAAIVVALFGAWLMLGVRISPGGDEGGLAINRSAERVRPGIAVPRGEMPDRLLPGGPAQMRMVSEGSPLGGPGDVSDRQSAIQSVTAAREDSLLRENEYLRLYIQKVERENLILRHYLFRAQSQQSQR